MLVNRSAPHARITPVLTVHDVRAAVTWHGRVLGMVEYVRIGEGHRAQIGFVGSPAEIIVADVRPGRRVPEDLRSHQIMLKVEDVNALVARAVADGATLVAPVHDWEYGERQATIDDPFGHQWVLTQTLVDTAPESFGCQTIVARC